MAGRVCDVVRRLAGRGWLAAALLTALWGAGPAAAQPAKASDAKAVATAGEVSVPADLVVANRHIATLRVLNEYGASPALRVEGIRERLGALLEKGGPQAVTISDTPGGIAVMLDGHLVFRILEGDADPDSGETPRDLAMSAARNFQTALRDIREAQDSKYLALAAGKAALATVVLGLLLWLVTKTYASIATRMRAWVRRRSAAVVPVWGEQLVGGGGFGELAVVPLRLAAWAIALLLLYQWTALVLEFFPYTRPWGEALLENLLSGLGRFGASMLGAVPGLAFVALIFVIARFVARVVRAFFEGVSDGRIEAGWIDETTARPTGRLLNVVVWLFALVAAYPYLPGSNSEAFKGIGVFVGLMMSIGASGIVNQAVSGLMLMYTRTLRPGEFVQIGDTEGTVTSVGFVTTRIETLRNVEVNVPNAVITGNVTRNFSRLVGNGGMRLATSVTIGYDTPWRQVRAMLLIAADRTTSVAKDPPPRVLQTNLQDFYVEYTLVVSVADPRRKVLVLDELHGHIQDVFNEHGVQIMSPNYEADPADKKVVPREQWYAAPAAASTAPATAAGHETIT